MCVHMREARTMSRLCRKSSTSTRLPREAAAPSTRALRSNCSHAQGPSFKIAHPCVTHALTSPLTSIFISPPLQHEKLQMASTAHLPRSSSSIPESEIGSGVISELNGDSTLELAECHRLSRRYVGVAKPSEFNHQAGIVMGKLGLQC